MGRELKRKEAKRMGKNVREVQKNNDKEKNAIKSFVLIIIVIIGLLFLTYLLSGIFATKEITWFDKSNKNEEITSNIKNRILAKETLRQLENEYYVYYYDSTKEDIEVTKVVESLPKITYRVDLHDEFNSNFIGEPSGIVDSIENLKVSNPTVIKVSNESIIAFYNGSDEIKELQ